MFYILLFSFLIDTVSLVKGTIVRISDLLLHGITVFSFLGPCCPGRLYSRNTDQTVIHLKMQMFDPFESYHPAGF